MSNILDMNEFRNTAAEITNNQAMVADAMGYILDMPDELFKTTFPHLVAEFKKSLKSGEFAESLVQPGMSAEQKEFHLAEIAETKQNLKELSSELIPEKISFIEIILDASIDAINKVPYRDTVKVQVELCNDKAKLPTYANPTDAGCDVYATEEVMINGGETAIIPTGLKMAIPVGWMVSVRPRSGLSAKTGIRVANAPGTIDSAYRDEVGIILTNTGIEPYVVHEGDRIAQFVIEPAPMIKFETVNSVAEIGENRNGGFGHSGV